MAPGPLALAQAPGVLTYYALYSTLNHSLQIYIARTLRTIYKFTAQADVQHEIGTARYVINNTHTLRYNSHYVTFVLIVNGCGIDYRFNERKI